MLIEVVENIGKMKKIGLFLSLFLYVLFNSFGCDRTSVVVTSATFDGTEYTYTANVCLGISPNWGPTGGITLNADQNITGTSTPTITSNYNYCSVDLTFNGQGCASAAMGQAPAGGTVQSASVTASASTGGGDLSYNPSGSPGWLAPEDIRGDCADCNNPAQLCWTVVFTTDDPISTIQLEGGESGTECPDEFDNTIPTVVVCIPADLSSVVNGGATTTVCEGDPIDLNSNCTTCVTSGGGRTTYSWSGPNGYSSTSDNPGSFSATANSGGTYTLSGETAGCPTQTTSVTVNLNPLPTGALGTPALYDCNSVDVPISFTGAGDWTFTYQIDGVDQAPITTGTNPYILSVSTAGTITLNATAGVTNTTCAGAGSVSGSTDAFISAVNSYAGSDFMPDPTTDYTIDATATAGNPGNDTILTPVPISNGTDENVPDGGSGSTSISLSGITSNCPLDAANIPTDAICFNYLHTKANNELGGTVCIGGNCVTIGVGDLKKTGGGGSGTRYCLPYGDVLNLLDGQSCSSTITLTLTDNGGSSSSGTIKNFEVNLQDAAITPRPNPSYSWAAASGGADVSFLSSTTIEDPVFNAPGGTAAGCYELTITDGAGCTSLDQVCFSALVLELGLMQFDAEVTAQNTVKLNWEFDELLKDKSYFVERSMDGINYVNLSSAVMPNETGQFEYTDIDPLSKGYYRLREEDPTGFKDYSMVRFVSLDKHNELSILKIFPQPVSNNSSVHVSVQSGKVRQAVINVLDLNGRLIDSFKRDLNQGVTTLDLPFKNAKAGLYALEITTMDRKIVAKVNKN